MKNITDRYKQTSQSVIKYLFFVTIPIKYLLGQAIQSPLKTYKYGYFLSPVTFKRFTTAIKL